MLLCSLNRTFDCVEGTLLDKTNSNKFYLLLCSLNRTFDCVEGTLLDKTN